MDWGDAVPQGRREVEACGYRGAGKTSRGIGLTGGGGWWVGGPVDP